MSAKRADTRCFIVFDLDRDAALHFLALFLFRILFRSFIISTVDTGSFLFRFDRVSVLRRCEESDVKSSGSMYPSTSGGIVSINSLLDFVDRSAFSSSHGRQYMADSDFAQYGVSSRSRLIPRSRQNLSSSSSINGKNKLSLSSIGVRPSSMLKMSSMVLQMLALLVQASSSPLVVHASSSPLPPLVVRSS